MDAAPVKPGVVFFSSVLTRVAYRETIETIFRFARNTREAWVRQFFRSLTTSVCVTSVTT
jgi:hypothetical protein